MILNMHEFQQRMRTDREFRRRILAARKAGTLAETLAAEGWELDLSQMEVRLPQVRTDVHAGDCYCGIISN